MQWTPVFSSALLLLSKLRGSHVLLPISLYARATYFCNSNFMYIIAIDYKPRDHSNSLTCILLRKSVR
jgi:hypothetical protein